ncbi:MAG: hypothetical protein U0075_20840 [Thermomicrobiales bacterium]
MRNRVVRTMVLLCASVLALFGALGTARPASAQPVTAPTTCQVGIYLRSLHSFDPNADTFGGDLWLWSVCPSQDDQPLHTMEFVNADNTAILLDVPGNPFWANRNVDGTFRYDWDERDFPFDRHTLTIEMEEGIDDVRKFIYEPDLANSGIDPSMQLPGGWQITGWTLSGGSNAYNTTFGDPELPPGGTSQYSRVTLSVDLARNDLSGFFKLTAVVYAAFIFSLVTYLMQMDTTSGIGPRVSLLAIALFSAAVNLINASNALGTSSGLTLVDWIHIIVLIYILIAAAVTVVSRLLLDRGWSVADVTRLNYRLGAVAVISFIVINISLVRQALAIG